MAANVAGVDPKITLMRWAACMGCNWEGQIAGMNISEAHARVLVAEGSGKGPIARESERDGRRKSFSLEKSGRFWTFPDLTNRQKS